MYALSAGQFFSQAFEKVPSRIVDGYGYVERHRVRASIPFDVTLLLSVLHPFH